MIAVVEEIECIKFSHLLLGAVEELFVDTEFFPFFVNHLQVLLTMIFAGETGETCGTLFYIIQIIIRIYQCPDKVGQVVVLLAVLLQAGRQQNGVIIVLFNVVILRIDVTLRNARKFSRFYASATLGSIEDVHPVAIIILLAEERGLHAHPVETVRVLNHVAQAVVAVASDVSGIVGRLFLGAVDELRNLE